MKSVDEINRLLVVARKQSLRALQEKLAITKSTYGYAEKIREVESAFLIASATANALTIVLDSTPLSDEDERFFLSLCG